MTAESALTSIDLLCDGITLAVGSMRGKIYIYDLRKAVEPLRSITAHKSSIQSLQFQNDTTKLVSPAAPFNLSPTGHVMERVNLKCLVSSTRRLRLSRLQ